MAGLMGLCAAFKNWITEEDAETAPAPEARFEPTPWHRVAMKYDVCRMSRPDLRSLADELYAAGVISRPDFLLLSLNPESQSAEWPGWDSFLTPGERDGRRDWIFEIETRLREKHPDFTYLAYQRRLLTFLKRVETARFEWRQAAPEVAAITTEQIRPIPQTPSNVLVMPRLRSRLAGAGTSS
jgi:hypothetical protein